MWTWKLVGAVALLLCSSLAAATTNTTTAGDFDATANSITENNLPSADSSTEATNAAISELPTNAPPSDSSPEVLVHTTQASNVSSVPSTSPQTSTTASVSSSVHSNSPTPFQPDTETTVMVDPVLTSSSAFLQSTPNPSPATDAPSPAVSRETSLGPTIPEELTTTTSSPQSSGIDESTTGESSSNSRSNMISRTPVTSTVTDAGASRTTLQANQQTANNIGSTENGGIQSEESASSDLFENLNQNETYTSQENGTFTTTPISEDISETSTEVSDSPTGCEVARERRDPTEEAVRHYYLVTVILVLVMNFGFCMVTMFCVYRIVKRYNTRSWDPPPIRYGSVDYGISMGRRNMGLDLSPETHAGIPLPPRATHERNDSVPIVITNEDGWCVPYHDGVHAKSPANLAEDNNQQMSTIGGEHDSPSPEEIRKHSDTGL